MERRYGLYYFIFIYKICMKYNTFSAFIKLSFPKIILTSYNVANIRLLRILHETLSRLSFKVLCYLQIGKI